MVDKHRLNTIVVDCWFGHFLGGWPHNWRILPSAKTWMSKLNGQWVENELLTNGLVEVMHEVYFMLHWECLVMSLFCYEQQILCIMEGKIRKDEDLDTSAVCFVYFSVCVCWACYWVWPIVKIFSSFSLFFYLQTTSRVSLMLFYGEILILHLILGRPYLVARKMS